MPSLRQSFALRPLEIKQVFDFPIRLLRTGFAPMFLATSMVQLPLAVLTLPLLLQVMKLAYEVQAMTNENNSEWMEAAFWESKLELAVFAGAMLIAALVYQVLVTPFGNLICARLAVCRLLGIECSFSDAWQFAKGRYWPTQVSIALFLLPLLLLSVVVLLIVLAAQSGGSDTGVIAAAGGGTLFIMLGALATLLAFPVLFPALNGMLQAAEEPQGDGVLAQGLWYLRRARDLTGGHFWRMAGYLIFLSVIVNYITRGVSESVQLVVALISSATSGSTEALQNMMTGVPGTWEMGLMLVLASLFGLLFPPYWQCFKTVLYFDLRCRKEGFDLLRQLGLPGAEISDEPAPAAA